MEADFPEFLIHFHLHNCATIYSSAVTFVTSCLDDGEMGDIKNVAFLLIQLKRWSEEMWIKSTWHRNHWTEGEIKRDLKYVQLFQLGDTFMLCWINELWLVNSQFLCAKRKQDRTAASKYFTLSKSLVSFWSILINTGDEICSTFYLIISYYIEKNELLNVYEVECVGFLLNFTVSWILY